MEATFSRRSLLQHLGMLAGVAGVAGGLAGVPLRALAADDVPHLSPSDPVASALGYSEDATKVDPGKYPSHQPGEKCANCLQNSGAPGQTWGPCKLFVGKLVNTNGWCSAYVKKG